MESHYILPLFFFSNTVVIARYTQPNFDWMFGSESDLKMYIQFLEGYGFIREKNVGPYFCTVLDDIATSARISSQRNKLQKNVKN